MDNRQAEPPPRFQALVAPVALTGVDYEVAARAVPLAADSSAIAAPGAPAAPAAGPAPAAPRVGVPLATAPPLLLPAAAAAAPPAVVAASPARAPPPSSSTTRQNGARWAKASALWWERPRPPRPWGRRPSKARRCQTRYLL